MGRMGLCRSIHGALRQVDCLLDIVWLLRPVMHRCEKVAKVVSVHWLHWMVFARIIENVPHDRDCFVESGQMLCSGVPSAEPLTQIALEHQLVLVRREVARDGLSGIRDASSRSTSALSA